MPPNINGDNVYAEIIIKINSIKFFISSIISIY
jgi:hypothetical protein